MNKWAQQEMNHTFICSTKSSTGFRNISGSANSSKSFWKTAEEYNLKTNRNKKKWIQSTENNKGGMQFYTIFGSLSYWNDTPPQIKTTKVECHLIIFGSWSFFPF